MGWQEEFGPDYEVPGLIDFMVREGIVEDFSWKNDASPSFAVKDPQDEGRGIRLWVAHPVMSLREFESKRFLVQEGEFISESDWEMDTDDLEEAVTAFLRRAEKHMPQDRRPDFDGLIEEWRRPTVR